MKSKYILFIPSIAFVIAVVYFMFLNTHNPEKFPVTGEDVMKHSKPSGALQSLQFLSQIRAFPEQDIPQEKFFSAVEYSKTMPKYDDRLTHAVDIDRSEQYRRQKSVYGFFAFRYCHPVYGLSLGRIVEINYRRTRCECMAVY